MNNFHDMPRSVLVVDDEEETIWIFRDTLTKEGFEVNGFTCPLDALEHFKNNHHNYRILAAGIRLQPISGFELVREAKEVKPDVKAILLSPFEMDMSEIEKVMPHLPVDDVVKKPLTPEQVRDIARMHFL